MSNNPGDPWVFRVKPKLEVLYGHLAEVMLSQPATSIWLKTKEPAASEWVSKFIGKVEIERLRETHFDGLPRWAKLHAAPPDRTAGDGIRNLRAGVLDISLGLRYNEFRVMKDDANNSLPLAPAALHILLSLAAEDLHGYGIMQDVARQSEGKYKLGPGTLYDNLQKLIRRRWVEEIGQRPGDDDPRRRYYRLSSLGRGVLTAETARLASVVREARLRLQVTKPRRA